jgi:hypothetical protein
MSVKKFVKKPVVVEARRLDESVFPASADDPIDPNTRAHAEIAGWMLGNGFRDFHVTGDRAPFGLTIDTLEGPMLANPGDWIIRGVQGEFYPCKPDIFEATYSPADLIISEN